MPRRGSAIRSQADVRSPPVADPCRVRFRQWRVSSLGASMEGVMAQTDLFTLPHKPWNAGRLVGAKAPLKPKHIWGDTPAAQIDRADT